MPDQNHQRIPRSVGLLLRVMRERKGLTRQAMAKALSAQPRRFVAAVTDSMVGRAERTERLFYFVLRLYAKLWHLPAGMIYVIAACGADLRDNNVTRVRDRARWLREFADCLDRDAEVLAEFNGNDNVPKHFEHLADDAQTARRCVLRYAKRVVSDRGVLVVYPVSAQQVKVYRLCLILYALW
ncbi:MAG: hypothetical protein AB7F78_25090, partial [Hyphomicrobiaceae bacterium]